MTTVSTEQLCELLTAAEVAAILKVKPATLSTWRSNRDGPDFIRVGPSTRAIRYERRAIDDWIESQRVTCGK
jgi:hypothetical protein